MENRSGMQIKGIVDWVAENPPESGIKFPNGKYKMSGQVENVACDGLFNYLVNHMIDGDAGATLGIKELHLGDDFTTTPLREDTGVGSPVHAQGDLENATSLTGTLDATVSTEDTFILTNVWTNVTNDETVANVAAMGVAGAFCAGHAIFHDDPGIVISGSNGTLTITYKFIFAPA